MVVDLEGDGIAESVVAAHCDGGNGTPPDGAYILARGAGGASTPPVIAETLVSPAENLTLVRLALRSDGTLTARARGYSTVNVPHCCPDLDLDLTWTRHGDHYTRAEAAARGAQVRARGSGQVVPDG